MSNHTLHFIGKCIRINIFQHLEDEDDEDEDDADDDDDESETNDDELDTDMIDDRDSPDEVGNIHLGWFVMLPYSEASWAMMIKLNV